MPSVTDRSDERRRPAQDRTARRRVLEAVLGIPFTDGNRVDVLRNGNEAFPALLDAIDGATATVDLLWFAWRQGAPSDALADALAARARSGVQVRVLLDGYGAQRIGRSVLGRMRRAGCQVLFYRPVPSWRPTIWNMRTHRRVLVCDGTVGFTGGLGIGDQWAGDGRRPGQWRDTAVRLRGPAVASLRGAFAGSWLQVGARSGATGRRYVAEHCPPLPPEGSSGVQVLSAASGPDWNQAAAAMAVLLDTARERIRVATPYVRLPGWLRSLVCETAGRGVRVQLLVSGPHVERPWVHLQGEREYRPLLDAGVEVWRYQPSLLHAKVVTVDGQAAMVGTSNLDVRSLTLNEQVCVLSDDPVLTTALDTDFDEDLRHSVRVTDAAWRARSPRRRLLALAADAAGRPLRGWGDTGLIGRRPGW